MTESEPLKDEKAAPAEPEGPAGLTEKDKKRVKIGILLGGSMFILLFIVLIILVSTSDLTPKPGPLPKPTRRNATNNPYVVEDNAQETPTKRIVILYNNRTKMEEANLTLPGVKPPYIRNTTENFEPDYIRVGFEQYDEHFLEVYYEDPQRERWEVPDFGYDDDPYSDVSACITPPQFDPVIPRADKKFEWKFYGKAKEGDPLITTENCRLQFYDKYMEFEARLQTDYIFGMGERIDTFLLKNDNYSLWNHEATYDYGQDSEKGTFSSHPFFLNRLKNKKDFIGVFLRNSNAMLFSFWHTREFGTFINFKTVGGILDFYIFHAADPDYIIKKYHSSIGRPYLPPFWSMGFNQARRGYDLKAIQDVVANHHKQEFEIPIDAVWADVELMNNYKAFTVDSTRFGGLKEYLQKLHNDFSMRFVAIANSGIKKEQGYKYYDEAIKDDCLIKSAFHFAKPFEGRTMADTTVWLDYFLHSAVLVWATGLHDLHDLAPYDGVWINDAEPTQICDGECDKASPNILLEDDNIPDPRHNSSEFDYLQYRPTLDRLELYTLPMAAYHCCNDIFYKQYNTHNIFSLQVANATYESLYALFEDRRFLVVSRSTWPGSGKVTSHYFAENYGTWESMIGSIPSMLNFNMFGIPHVGAPIGGFYGDATPELLARWYELGCFYPLMLSYTNSNNKPKEAYANPEIAPYIKAAILERYSLLHWMYTQIFESFLWGGSVVHPVFFEFPTSEELYKKEILDRTFMWGKSLYIIPALIHGQTRTKAFVPNWRWYDLRTREIVRDYIEGSEGQYEIFDQPLGSITVLIKGGSIVVYQRDAKEYKIMNTEDLKRRLGLIVVAPDHLGKAQGTLIVDSDGIRPHPDPDSNTYRHYSFTYMNQIFRINKLAGFDFHTFYDIDFFDDLIILDVFGKHTVDYVCMMDTDLLKKELEFTHTMGSNAISIHDHGFGKMPMFKLETIVWGSHEQHDFCKFSMFLDQMRYENEGRTMIGEIITMDPSAYQLKFDLKASVLTDQIISMQIIMIDRGVQPWIVPDVVPDTVRKEFKTTQQISQSGFKVSNFHVPFHFEIADPSDPHDFIITTRNHPFVYVKNFIHFKITANSRHIFGLGERLGKFELADGIYTLWNKDQMIEENGLPPGHNLYSSHPFYLLHLHNPKQFAGVFFLNSNPIDVKIKHLGMQTQIDHIFIGGIVDGFFIQKGSVESVLKCYHYLVGNPIALPYWAFGYHQSRWGYKDIEHLKDVVKKFENNNIPLDGVWIDKDYMQHNRIFTIDTKRWYGLKQFVNELHSKDKRLMALLDPGIAIDPSYEVYKTALSLGIFIKTEKNEILKGVTWPGYSAWIDFLHPSAIKFWEDKLQEFHDNVPYDGILLDMNEPSNFCDGDCPDETHYVYYYFPLDFYDDLYYNPTHDPLEDSTISMEAIHYGDPKVANEFNYHNLYAYYQALATARFFADRLHQRPFVISSGTFPGMGRFASHWLGDNWASWHYLEYSIAGIFNFQMFGIPFVGADICGFAGNTTINLCSRWMQLGAFYPFMRNHNGPQHAPHEPYIDPKLMDVSIKAIRTRYSLARYIYSEYMHVARFGGSIFKPVLFDFPEDKFLYKILDITLMFGNAIRVTPVLENDVSVLESYFPNWDWYELSTLTKVMSYNASAKIGKNLTLACSLESGNLNVHVRGGRIFAYQPEASKDLAVSAITKLLKYPVELLIIPDHNGTAKGNIYYDDEHPKNWRTDYHDISLALENSLVELKLATGNPSYQYPFEDERISMVIVLNAGAYRDTKCAKYFDTKDNKNVNLEYSYDTVKEILRLNPKENKMIISNVGKIYWSNDSNC